MELETFLWKYKMTSSELAEKVGCAYSTMTSYVRKKRKPKLPMAEKIERATHGEVTAAELMTGRYKMACRLEFVTKTKESQESVETNNKICL